MKKLTLIFLITLSVFIKAATPTAADLKNYYSAGQVCICIHFKDSTVCNDIVWCGTYNGWSTDISNLKKFQSVKNFDGWWVVAFNDDSSNRCGKPVQLKDDGSFDWKYQTGDTSTWTILSGTATIESNEWYEGELRQIDNTTPIIATSTGWKNEVCTSPQPPQPPQPTQPEPSKTLPVLYINTEHSTPITSKDEYLQATYYLDNLGLSGYKSIASKDAPDTMQIKGRGNWTWSGFDKKPYRLKLNNKRALMGLDKSKHWTLLAHADDQFGWLKNTVGFYMSEQLGIKWTPKQAALEVVLNGDYIGLYMLTEQIRIDDKRVTADYIVEIDNYKEDGNIEFTEPANQWHGDQLVWVTPKDPDIDEISKDQHDYLQSQMEAINTALYETTETNLVNILDMNEAAKYYLVCELMSDCESYHGSCYLYKNKNENENQWCFGPVWDFGNSFNDRNMFIYDTPTWSQVWIGQLASKDSFNYCRDKLWKHWKYYDYANISNMVDSFAVLIKEAAKSDAARWPNYNHSDMDGQTKDFLAMYDRHVNWLVSQWGDGEEDKPTTIPSIRNEELGIKKVIINDQLYIIRDEKMYTVMGSGTSADQLPR